MERRELSFAHLTDQERLQLGERLRGARERAMMTQTEVAKRLGVTQATISRFETGERGIEVAELLVLARFYGVGLSWFLESLA